MDAPVQLAELRTTDPQQAFDATRAAFGDSADLRLPDHGRAALALRTVGSDDLQAVRFQVSGNALGTRDAHDESRPMLVTGLLLHGDMALTDRDGTRLDVSRPFLYPDIVTADVDMFEFACLLIPEDLIADRGRAIAGDDRAEVRFTGTAPFSPTFDRIWRNTIAYADRSLRELAGEPGTELARTGIVDLVATQLLRSFPNTALDAAEERRAHAGSAGLRRALQYIDDHLAEPFSAVDLARASGLSLRGLHAAFQRDLETTPMAFVRQARLSAARAELRQMDPATTDVRAVAFRWGFTTADTFTRRYRRAFEESPEQTLRR